MKRDRATGICARTPHLPSLVKKNQRIPCYAWAMALFYMYNFYRQHDTSNQRRPCWVPIMRPAGSL